MIVDNLFLTQDLTAIHPDNLHMFGLLVTANKPVDHVPDFIANGGWWILDNGAFTKKGFLEWHWIDWLSAMEPYKEKCICVVIPDVVGSAKKTLQQFPEYEYKASSLGYRIALVTQDGMIPAMLNWYMFDVLFIGGTDNHKMGREAGYLIQEGLRRGKHIHVGRVNTEYRLLQFWQCHTWDGTALTIKPEKYESIIVNGLRAVIDKKQQPALFSF
jgi:hypothetical protein